MSPPKLPLDVLYEVFKTLAALDPISPSSPYGWIRQSTHVCKSWRSAALGQTELWAGIVCAFKSTSVTNLLIERAGSAPLVFQGIEPPRSSFLTEHQLDLALRHIDNIRTLVHPAAHEPLSMIFDGRTLPHLEVMHVSQIQPSSVPVLPSLRTLSLRFCCFPIHAPQLRYLSLKFVGLEIPRAATPVLDILAQATLLEELRLSDLPRAIASEVATYPTVTLANLRLARISSKFFDSTFWQKLLLPVNLDLGINVYNAEEPQQQNIDVSNIFATVSRQLASEDFDSLRVVEDRERDTPYDGVHLIVKLWSSRASISPTAFYLDARVYIYTEDELDIERELQSLIPYLNVEHVGHVDLSGLTEMAFVDDIAMRRALAPLVYVESAVIHYGEQLELLLPQGFWHDKDVSGDGIFPNLQELTVADFLCGCNCKKLDHGDPPAKAWPLLLDILQKRQQSAHPIRTLAINRIVESHSAPQADSLGWIEADEAHMPWVERAREYTEAVVSKLSTRGVGASLEEYETAEREFDWHIAGPKYQYFRKQVPARSDGRRGQIISNEDWESD
ncbi:hypothetical protein PENSPDRAFT_754353 [Peniophora sp. CONT]|nr:hypothetical protein PENSPDRAFT_754353 [Peniophora sp. CONT]